MIPSPCQAVPAEKTPQILLAGLWTIREAMSILNCANLAFLAETAEDFDSCQMSTALSEKEGKA